MNTQPLILIPAAGFGTRVGSPLAKEMMIDPEGRPLIDFALEQALARDWPVHVITREEKKPLMEHLEMWKSRGLKVSWQFVSPTKEWPETLLKSQPFWQERNLVVLPDTRYQPLDILDQMQAIANTEVVYAVCELTDLQKASSWGVIRPVSSSKFSLCEKPQNLLRHPYLFWGLMLFQKAAGLALLQAHLQSTLDHQWQSPQLRMSVVHLESFIDLTRGI